MSSPTQLLEIPSKSLVLLIGPPGSGKSTFCHEAVIRNIEMSPVIYVTTESAPSKVAEDELISFVRKEFREMQGYLETHMLEELEKKMS